ncbi:MAG TPA: SRPBCC family protein [Bacteroidota bacterium]|nr:SRPBCC family protein [Bacteroidota bacterium]
MRTETSITIRAPLDKIFETVADLSLWPIILPHYRWVKFIEQSPTRSVVKMAAKRKWIPVQWTSELEIDRERKEIRFHHLKAFTKGMRVIWSFMQDDEEVRVTIRHDLEHTIPLIGKFVAEHIIGQFFIGYIANQTLQHMKRHAEAKYGS